MGLNCIGGSLDDIKANHKVLYPDEQRWVKLQPFLLRHGYRLRPKYHPDWTPSWEKRSFIFKPDFWKCEDRLSPPQPGIMDAVRVSDGAKVVIKEFSTTRSELCLLQMLNSKDMRAHPRNKTVPIFDLLLAPDTDEVAFAVMPRLMETLVIPFQFVGEVFDAFSSYLNTVAFLHEHMIAHMDVCSGNLMMDVTKLVPSGFHISRPTCRESDPTKSIKYKSRRETGPIDYYLIDFGISRDLSPASGKFGRRFAGCWGQDKTIPEFADRYAPHDPFKVDICQLGNVFKKIVTHYEGLSVLEPLAQAMTAKNPDDRPSAADACQHLREIEMSLSDDELGKRIFYRVASKSLRRQLVRGRSPPEFLECYRLLFPEWYARVPDTDSSEKASTNEK